MSHFSHTNVYFVEEEDEDTIDGDSQELLASAEVNEDSDSEDDIDNDEA